MGAKKKYDGETRHGDIRWFKPDALVLIDDKEHALYDERVKLEVDPALVESIRGNGIIQPITIMTDGDKAIVVAGRQRVKAARIVGCEVPCIIRKGDSVDLAEAMIAENEIRRGDPPSLRARKMQHLKNAGADDARCARAFGCTVKTVQNTLRLLDCAAEVVKAVDAGEIGVVIASDLSKQPRAEQVHALGVMRENNATRGKAARDVVDKKKPKPKERMRSRALIERLCKKGDLSAHDHAILSWVCGDDDADVGGTFRRGIEKVTAKTEK